MGERFIKAEAFGKFDCKITTEKKFLWFPPETVEYVGNCTAWHRYPDAKRMDTDHEMWLCRMWTRWKWQQKDREAA